MIASFVGEKDTHWVRNIYEFWFAIISTIYEVTGLTPAEFNLQRALVGSGKGISESPWLGDGQRTMDTKCKECISELQGNRISTSALNCYIQMVGQYLTPGEWSVLGARTLPFDYMPPKQGNFPSKKTHKKRLKMPKISKRFLLTPSPPLTARTAVGCCLSTCLSGSDPFLAFYCQIQGIPLNAPQANLSQ